MSMSQIMGDREIKFVVDATKHGYTQAEIARAMNVCVRTIQRALINAGYDAYRLKKLHPPLKYEWEDTE